MKQFRYVVIILSLLWLLPSSSQAQSGADNLLVNGGFEQGFQAEFGLGYGWGGFSNGNAIVGWNADTWEAVVKAGQYSQLIQLEAADSPDRYAGIYQTVTVRSGEAYELTINGLIRAQTEDDFAANEYRLQYALDLTGGTGWEQLPDSAWQTVTETVYPLYQADGRAYGFQQFQTVITAESSELTLFIRGQKVEASDDIVIFNLDDVQLRPRNATVEVETTTTTAAPVEKPIEREETLADQRLASAATDALPDLERVPDQFTAPAVEAEVVIEDEAAAPQAIVEDTSPSESAADEADSLPAADVETDTSSVEADTSATATESTESPTVAADRPTAESLVSQMDVPLETSLQPTARLAETDSDSADIPAPLPVTGLVSETTALYLLVTGVTLLVVLLIGTMFTLRRRM